MVGRTSLSHDAPCRSVTICSPEATRRALGAIRRVAVTYVYDLSAWIIRVPEIEAKLVLGDCLHDLVWVASKLRDREVELLGEPDDTPLLKASMSSASSTRQRLTVLVNAISELMFRLELVRAPLDTILDARSHEALVEADHLLRRRAQIITAKAIPDVGGHDRLDPYGGYLDWRIPHLPARDGRFTVVSEVPRPLKEDPPSTVAVKRFHFLLMSTEVPTIEHCARLILKARGVRPWEFVRDMGRQIFDEVRHAEACIREIRLAGAELGAFPVELNLWLATRDASIDLSLSIHQRIGERIGIETAAWGRSDAGRVALGERAAAIFDFILCDEVAHVSYGNRWIERDRDELLDEAKVARAAVGLGSEGLVSYEASLDLYLAAGFTEQEAAELKVKDS
jgi:hypothetical protein